MLSYFYLQLKGVNSGEYHQKSDTNSGSQRLSESPLPSPLKPQQVSENSPQGESLVGHLVSPLSGQAGRRQQLSLALWLRFSFAAPTRLACKGSCKHFLPSNHTRRMWVTGVCVCFSFRLLWTDVVSAHFLSVTSSFFLCQNFRYTVDDL